MVRDDLIALCCGAVMSGGGFGFGWYMTPEPAELKLGRILAEMERPFPVRTLPPDVPAIRCMMVWVGAAGPELWCPAVPPMPEEPEQQPAVPTS